MRIEAVEAAIALAVCRTAEALPESSRVFGRGYDALVYHACLRALSEEMRAGDGAGNAAKPHSPCAAATGEGGALCLASVDAVKRTRRKIGDRFFRKKWLPLEANPDVFNALGEQLGLPTAAVHLCVCVCVCVCVRAFVRVRAYSCVCVCACVRAYLPTCMHACMHTHTSGALPRRVRNG